MSMSGPTALESVIQADLIAEFKKTWPCQVLVFLETRFVDFSLPATDASRLFVEMTRRAASESWTNCLKKNSPRLTVLTTRKSGVERFFSILPQLLAVLFSYFMLFRLTVDHAQIDTGSCSRSSGYQLLILYCSQGPAVVNAAAFTSHHSWLKCQRLGAHRIDFEKLSYGNRR